MNKTPHKILFSNGDVISDYGNDSAFNLMDCIRHVASFKPQVKESGVVLPDGSVNLSKIILTSDTHAGHALVCDLRGYGKLPEGIEAHTDILIDSLSSMATPDTVLIVLGDVTMHKVTALDFLDEIPTAAKGLIAGNHDRISTLFERGRSAEGYLKYFDFIVTKGSIDSGIDRLIISHVPPIAGEHSADQEPRFANKRMKLARWPEGNMVIHGHVHSQWKINGGCLNVGIDVFSAGISLEVAYGLLVNSIQPGDACSAGDLNMADVIL